jgi:hypothetical protein
MCGDHLSKREWEAADEEVDLMSFVGDANACCISQEGVDIVIQRVAILRRSKVVSGILIRQVAEFME